MRLRRRGDYASGTDSEFAVPERVIICAVLASLSAFRPSSPTEAGRAAAGAQIITGEC
ncbi:hypothetical protein BH18VER1_BH18VER1_19020 [soil metagenome]